MVLSGMKWLMEIGYKVHEVLQRLLTLHWIERIVGERGSKPFNLLCDALSVWAMPMRIVLGFVNLDIYIMPRSGLLVADLVRPRRDIDERVPLQQVRHRSFGRRS